MAPPSSGSTTSAIEYEAVAPCLACGTRLTKENGKAFWVQTGLGITVLRVCKGSDCEARAIEEHREQPVHRIPRPVTKEEREAA
jgi:hypothetical protein